MTLLIAIVIFIIGVAIIVEATEKFVEGLLGASALFGISTFVLGVLACGFEPENLVAGLAGATKNMPGVAMGTIIGSSIFLIAVAMGLAGILAPMEINLPRRYIYLTVAAPAPLLLLMLDGFLSRWDGLILLVLFAPVMWYVLRASDEEKKVFLNKESDKLREEGQKKPRWFFPALMLGSTVAMMVGAELMARSAKEIVRGLGLSETAFGMVIVSAAVSFEEIAREVIPAYRGHPEISIGNILGTIFFLIFFNTGLIALICPLRIEKSIVYFHCPFMMGLVALTALFLSRKRVGRIEGSILLLSYGLYLILNYAVYRP